MSNNEDTKRYDWINGLEHPAPALNREQRTALTTWAMTQLMKPLTPSKFATLKKAHQLYGIFPTSMIALSNDITKDQLEITRKRSGGDRCPCCVQYVKEYRRSLSKNMCRFLQSLVYQSELKKAETGSGWVKFKDCEYGSHDYPYVADWKLAERHPDKQGYYRPTTLGIQFAFGKASVPKYIYTYNGAVTGEDGTTMIKIGDVKFERFDLDTMLQGEIPQADTTPVVIEEQDDPQVRLF